MFSAFRKLASLLFHKHKETCEWLEKQGKAIGKLPKHRMLTRINQHDENKLKARKKSYSFLLYCVSHTHMHSFFFLNTLPGNRFDCVSSFAALWLSKHTSRSTETLPWTLPKGQGTIVFPTLRRGPRERRWIHLLGDMNLPWNDNV